VPGEWNIDDMSVPRYWKRAARELSERDVVLRKIIDATPGLTLRSRGDAFHTLARSIVGQQISVKAADSIWQKFNASVHTITPHTVHKHNVDRLRTCGLSHSKITYLQDLSLHFLEKKLVPEKWDEMSDDQLIIELTKVKGIGRWTAEMFLIFHLTRPNVFPIADLGLQRAMNLHYNRGKPLSRRKIGQIEKNWQPWCSVATWYMWRSLDPIPVEY
jgi:DNA-3-methyladenine glycosylase II